MKNRSAESSGAGRRLTVWAALWWVVMSWAAANPASVSGQDPPQTPASPPAQASPGLDDVLGRVEQRYEVPAFSARFFQTSTLKAMDIVDTARGKIYIKRPGRMRWEYETPERQIIVSDGVQLWIFRPDDHQVMIGKAPAFFGDGKGASFLSDVRKMRENFTITLVDRPDTDNHVLKLVPNRQTNDLSEIVLSVSWADFHIDEITTVNAYGDETRIVLSDTDFEGQLADDLFEFVIPQGVEVLQMTP